MGKFDKKVMKHEPDAPTSLIKKKKKGGKELASLEVNKGAEKERNLKVLGLLQKEKEYNAGGEKSENATDKNKMAKQYQKKSEKARKYSKKE